MAQNFNISSNSIVDLVGKIKTATEIIDGRKAKYLIVGPEILLRLRHEIEHSQASLSKIGITNPSELSVDQVLGLTVVEAQDKMFNMMVGF